MNLLEPMRSNIICNILFVINKKVFINYSYYICLYYVHFETFKHAKNILCQNL